MMLPIRKKKINEFTSYLASEYTDGKKTLLEDVLASEDLLCHVDHYEDYFDGMLTYNEVDFNIHINIDRGNNLSFKRGRFTLGHELAHYFLDEHRIGLKYGFLESHGSKYELNQKDPIELEADYFAACLLMPYDKMRNLDRSMKFSLQKILAISDYFQASVLASVLRYIELCVHELMIVVSKENQVLWYAQNEPFPKWPFRFRVHHQLPPTTVAGEFFTKLDSKFTSIEEVNPDDWFYPFPNDNRANRKMNEQCYYSDSYGYVISLLWFK